MIESLHRHHPGLLYKLTFLFAFVAAFTFLTLKLPQLSSAASLDNFRPGNIISDYTMGNYESMNLEEIDAFLHQKGNCNDTDTVKASWYPSLHYHIENGHFVCLADERFATSGSNYGDLLQDDEPSQSAAEIIYEVSQAYKINPQVLIVLLEKEQGLISDSWPNSIQFRSATGFGCPDTAPCDSGYYGLKNQLESAAWLFRTVLDGGWTNYPLGENYIYYNPNHDCGGSIVNIENLATSSLYRYTPYQPNAAALAAGYGTATCGAYGNRNFYLFFSDFFSDPAYTEPQVSIQNAELPNGEYKIISFISQDLHLTFFEEHLSNSSTPQNWQIEQQDDSYLILQGDKVLIANNNGKIALESKSEENDDSQKWIINQNEDQTYTIYSKKYLTVLDVDNASTENGTLVKLYKQWGDNNSAQKWWLEKIEKTEKVEAPSDADADVGSDNNGETPTAEEDFTGDYYILSGINNQAIDVYGGGTANGTNVWIYPHSANNQAQIWRITKQNDYYTIINPNSGKALDVNNGAITSNSNVQIYEPNNTCAQQWNIVQNSDGSVSIKNACEPSQVLDVQDYNTNIQIYIAWGDNNSAQKWWLEKI